MGEADGREQKMMKAAIVNPYLDTLGGGERYAMAVAATLVKVGYKVAVEWQEKSIKTKLEKRFGIKLEGVEFVEDVGRGDGYELCFWVSDGSIPTLRARRNILHFQIPFRGVRGKSILNRVKLSRIGAVVCNSKFTKRIVDEEYGFSEKSRVLYPPVEVEKFKPKRRKEKMILSVGRFSQLAQAKRQDVLVEVFKKLNLAGWKLVLVGGSEVGAEGYLENLKKESAGWPIEIREGASFEELRELYGVAKLYWSASGYGVNEVCEPKRVEHFGIAVVEAMSAGCAPLVFDAGGHRETVREGVNGFRWRKKSELAMKTMRLVEDKQLWRRVTQRAKPDSKRYGYERFERELSVLL